MIGRAISACFTRSSLEQEALISIFMKKRSGLFLQRTRVPPLIHFWYTVACMNPTSTLRFFDWSAHLIVSLLLFLSFVFCCCCCCFYFFVLLTGLSRWSAATPRASPAWPNTFEPRRRRKPRSATFVRTASPAQLVRAFCLACLEMTWLAGCLLLFSFFFFAARYWVDSACFCHTSAPKYRRRPRWYSGILV